MKYSIITPVYNREDCISRCIESVLSQVKKTKWGGDIEHIIVNDGSTDLTDTICKGYVRCNNHIKYISFLENRGTNAARNAAIREAEGTFSIILDSDDYFVENAFEIIDGVLSERSGYRHYMFAPNDVNYDKSILSGCNELELNYIDFLSGNVNTGFIHCIHTDIMKKYPFDESVRIHEGVFFLSFYKEAQRMFFTNKVVTIRERRRSDSVTFDVVRTKKVFIERGIRANEIMLSQFGEDMMSYNCLQMLSNLYLYLFDNYLLLGKYDKIIQLRQLYKKNYFFYVPQTLKQKILNVLTFLRLGILYRILLQSYLKMKYSVFKVKIK